MISIPWLSSESVNNETFLVQWSIYIVVENSCRAHEWTNRVTFSRVDFLEDERRRWRGSKRFSIDPCKAILSLQTEVCESATFRTGFMQVRRIDAWTKATVSFATVWTTSGCFLSRSNSARLLRSFLDSFENLLSWPFPPDEELECRGGLKFLSIETDTSEGHLKNIFVNNAYLSHYRL